MADNSKLLMGWFCPTIGDTSAYGDPSKSVPPSAEMFERVALSAEKAGFDFMLVPVTSHMLGRLGHGRLSRGAHQQAEVPGRHQARLPAPGRAREDDRHL